jgi:hypothetical protein
MRFLISISLAGVALAAFASQLRWGKNRRGHRRSPGLRQNREPGMTPGSKITNFN